MVLKKTEYKSRACHIIVMFKRWQTTYEDGPQFLKRAFLPKTALNKNGWIRGSGVVTYGSANEQLLLWRCRVGKSGHQ